MKFPLEFTGDHSFGGEDNVDILCIVGWENQGREVEM